MRPAAYPLVVVRRVVAGGLYAARNHTADDY